MAKRGRPSAASQAVTVIDHEGGAVALVERPEPPVHLTPEEEDEWRAVVGSLPADWFPRETHALLEQYCRHAVNARRQGQMMDTAMARDEIDVAEIKEIAGLQSKTTASMKALAASMRLSQQSTYTDKAGGTAKRNGGGKMKRPWET